MYKRTKTEAFQIGLLSMQFYLKDQPKRTDTRKKIWH